MTHFRNSLFAHFQISSTTAIIDEQTNSPTKNITAVLKQIFTKDLSLNYISALRQVDHKIFQEKNISYLYAHAIVIY